MTYVINKFNNQSLTSVLAGTINDSVTDIRLVGRGVVNYGELMAENLVWMVEHFAADSAPPKPLIGQIWYDTNNKRLLVYKGSVIGWSPIGTVQAGNTSPNNPQEGDLWYDTTTREVKVYNGNLHGTNAPGWDAVGPARYGVNEPTTNKADGDLFWNSDTKQLFGYDAIQDEWRLIGPLSAGGTHGNNGYTGFRTVVLQDAFPNDHEVIEYVVNDEILAILSPTAFTPVPALAGFPSLIRGMNYKASNVSVDIKDGTLTVQSTASSDSYVVFNFNETGTPTLNAGLQVKRGTSPDAVLRWNETTNNWEISEDGANFYEVVTTGNINTILNIGGGSSTVEWVDVLNTPTTVGGYGITDAVSLTGIQTLTNKTLTSPTINNPALTGYKETSVTANATGAYAIDVTTGNVHVLTLTGNTTLSFTNVYGAGVACSLTLVIKQDGTGNRTLTWPASVKWSGGTPATSSTATNAIDVYTAFTVDGGTSWLVSQAMKGAA